MISTKFLLAGRAIFTVSNDKGEHYTFCVAAPRKQQDEQNPCFFVSALTGPDNQHDYTYLGLLNGKSGNVVITAKSAWKPENGVDQKIVKVARWAIRLVWEQKEVPAGYKIQHSGRCSACGRELTDPVSIETGLGPICAGRQ